MQMPEITLPDVSTLQNYLTAFLVLAGLWGAWKVVKFAKYLISTLVFGLSLPKLAILMGVGGLSLAGFGLGGAIGIDTEEQTRDKYIVNLTKNKEIDTDRLKVAIEELNKRQIDSQQNPPKLQANLTGTMVLGGFGLASVGLITAVCWGESNSYSKFKHDN